MTQWHFEKSTGHCEWTNGTHQTLSVWTCNHGYTTTHKVNVSLLRSSRWAQMESFCPLSKPTRNTNIGRVQVLMPFLQNTSCFQRPVNRIEVALRENIGSIMSEEAFKLHYPNHHHKNCKQFESALSAPSIFCRSVPFMSMFNICNVPIYFRFKSPN